MTRERELPNDDVSKWLRAHPEAWDVSRESFNEAEVEQLVAEITSGSLADARPRSSTRRRLALGTVVAATTVGVAFGAVALLRGEQPTRPNEAVTCAAEAAWPPATVVVVDATAQPIEACDAAWADVALLGSHAPGGSVPTLAACVSPAGGVVVFPGEPAVCSDLGMPVLADALEPEAQSLLRLQERIIAEINARPCASAEAVTLSISAILQEEGFDDWRIEALGDANSMDCAKAAVDAPARRVTLAQGL